MTRWHSLFQASKSQVSKSNVHLGIFLCLVGALFSASSTSAHKSATSENKKAQSKVQEPKEQKLAQRRKVAFTEFAAVNLTGLGEMEKLSFAQIVNDEICPCDCPQSFGACLQKGTQCTPAVLLGNWIADQLRNGVPGDVLAEQVNREVSGGFGAKPVKIKTAGFGSKGAKKPRFTLVEYADFECGHCRAASSVVDRLVKEHARDVKVVFKHFPLSFHQWAVPAAIATEAAGKQGRFWEMHNAIFATQNMLDEALIMGHAKALGLDMKRFKADFKSPALAAKVKASREEGERLGIEATPSFYINGRPFNLMRTPQAFELRFAMEEARASASCAVK